MISIMTERNENRKINVINNSNRSGENNNESENEERMIGGEATLPNTITHHSSINFLSHRQTSIIVANAATPNIGDVIIANANAISVNITNNFTITQHLYEHLYEHLYNY